MMHEPHVGASREAEQMVTVTVDFCMFEKWQKEMSALFLAAMVDVGS